MPPNGISWRYDPKKEADEVQSVKNVTNKKSKNLFIGSRVE